MNLSSVAWAWDLESAGVNVWAERGSWWNDSEVPESACAVPAHTVKQNSFGQTDCLRETARGLLKGNRKCCCRECRKEPGVSRELAQGNVTRVPGSQIDADVWCLPRSSCGTVQKAFLNPASFICKMKCQPKIHARELKWESQKKWSPKTLIFYSQRIILTIKWAKLCVSALYAVSHYANTAL